MIRGLARDLAAVMCCFFLVTGPALADSRDDALATVRALTGEISNRLANDQLTDDELWAGIQGLSDAFYRFTLSETEFRSEQKVGAPIFSSLRPGQAEPIENTRPGQKVTLAEVPRAWFTKSIGDSQRALDRVRTLLEGAASPAEMLTALSGFDASLDLINRPPSDG